MTASRERRTHPRAGGQRLPHGTRLGPVHLGVTDAARATAFWTATLGLTLLERSSAAIELGADGRPLVVLHADASSPVRRGETGLYHLAIHFTARREFARILARLLTLQHPHAPTDHLVTETTYLWDPDGNGIELTFETPQRGVLLYEGDQLLARAADGQIRSGRDPLDVAGVLTELRGSEDLMAPIAGARIGHVHLHVAGLDDARRFYRDVIGLHDIRHMPAVQMSELGIDEAVPHTLALNTWSGVGAPAPPNARAGLRHVSLELPSRADLDALAARLTAARWPFDRRTGADEIDLRDPSSNRWRARLSGKA